MACFSLSDKCPKLSSFRFLGGEGDSNKVLIKVRYKLVGFPGLLVIRHRVNVIYGSRAIYENITLAQTASVYLLPLSSYKGLFLGFMSNRVKRKLYSHMSYLILVS
ncbi:hypothetical protein NQ315_010069 [Exocentrus adspersus]|uniref:Uncharacterized protein n=1 Tax=Exocentrus adspersus TaxID=1586481 RepID=A0AAV8WA96_9CUCU|nr:hypothetical protein NQ315_010069 [Exocentrus adspersus]